MAPGIVNIQLDQSIIKLFIFSIPLIKLKISTFCGVMYGYGMNYIFLKKTIHKVRENTWHNTSTSISLVSVCCQIMLLLVSMIQNKIDLDISLFLIEDVEMYVRNVNVGMFALL